MTKSLTGWVLAYRTLNQNDHRTGLSYLILITPQRQHVPLEYTMNWAKVKKHIVLYLCQLQTNNAREKTDPDTCWTYQTWPRTPGEILPLEPPIRMITGPEWAAWFWQRNMCHWNTRTKPRLMVHLMSISDFKYQEKGWSRWLLKTGNPSWDVRWVFKFQTQHQNASTGLECAACYWHWHWGSM